MFTVREANGRTDGHNDDGRRTIGDLKTLAFSSSKLKQQHQKTKQRTPTNT